MSIRSLTLLLAAIFAVYFYFAYMGGSNGELISGLLITSDKDEKIIDVEFNGAIRYLGHFPEKDGDILQVKFRTITFSGEKENYSLLKKLQFTGLQKRDYIEDIRYEGDVPGGPFLVVRFSQPVSFSVSEANGLRSLQINYKVI